MDKELEEIIERLNRFSHITVLYSNTVAMDAQELKQVQQDVETLIQSVENSIPKEVVEEKIKEMERMSKLAEECINEKIIIADSDSLHFGEKIAHKTDANILRELLQKKERDKNEFKYKV